MFACSPFHVQNLVGFKFLAWVSLEFGLDDQLYCHDDCFLMYMALGNPVENSSAPGTDYLAS